MHRHPVLLDIRLLYEGMKIAGKAITVHNFPGDWTKPVDASDVAASGNIVVINNSSNYVAPWGKLASQRRDRWTICNMDEIRRMKFPEFASAIVINAAELKGMGEINVEITCGGQTVRPGDWVIRGNNNVMMMPRIGHIG